MSLSRALEHGSPKVAPPGATSASARNVQSSSPGTVAPMLLRGEDGCERQCGNAVPDGVEPGTPEEPRGYCAGEREKRSEVGERTHPAEGDEQANGPAITKAEAALDVEGILGDAQSASEGVLCDVIQSDLVPGYPAAGAGVV